MKSIPIIKQYRSKLTEQSRRKSEEIAEELIRKDPGLSVDKRFRALMPDHLKHAVSLHLDDLGCIRLPGRHSDILYMQDRARLRAGDGDLVASCAMPMCGFEDYCRDYLGLGSPTWLHPCPRSNPLRLATACLGDRRVRRSLHHAIRHAPLFYIHPHMGTQPVWQLAAFLQESARRPVKVIAPPPAVAELANDKLRFSDLVRRSLGDRFLPPTREAANLNTLTRLVRDLAGSRRKLVIKLPDSVGGGGNVVLSSDRVRGRSLAGIRTILKRLTKDLDWEGQCKLLVGGWETDIVSTPSAQLWIPPLAERPPVVEGLFAQLIEGAEGIFVGNKPAALPDALSQEIVDHCTLLGLVLQRLGYVGRCSFDLILVGTDPADCRIEFIECNGRWGGTSIPMTLMNRLLGDWTRCPYAVRVCYAEGLDCLNFLDVLDFFVSELFDIRTGQGRLVFLTPGHMKTASSVTALAMGATWEEAQTFIDEELPELLRDCVCVMA